jgi:hypothetical protein
LNLCWGHPMCEGVQAGPTPCAVCVGVLRAAGVTIPIVAMTGDDGQRGPGSVEVFKLAGFNALLSKPFGEVRCCVCRGGGGVAHVARCCPYRA